MPYLNKHYSRERMEKVWAGKKNKPAWNKKIGVLKSCLECGKEFEWRDSPSRVKENWGKYCSRECKHKSLLGKTPWNKGTKGIMKAWNKGKPNLNGRKKNNRASERRVAMGRIEYILWRTAVFMRDEYNCQNCGQHGGRLEADHIKPWALFPDLRYAIDNGRTLCKPCHKEIGWNLFRENNPSIRKAM